MDEKKELRKQVNELLGRELSDEKAQGIDFSGIVEDLEPNFDDLSHSVIGPMAIVATGMACLLMGISIYDWLAFLGVASCVGTVSVVLGWAFLWKRKRVDAKKQILEAIQKYEERKEKVLH